MFVEGKNTDGSGERWLNKIENKIYELAESKAKFALCNAPQLSRFQYCCYSYKGWVIAFKNSEKKFEVYRIIWGSYLSY